MFHPAPAPSQEDIEQLVEKASRRIPRFLQRRGVITLVSAPARPHRMVVRDVVRTKNRIKSMHRSRGVAAAGKSVYSSAGREPWHAQLPAACRGPVRTLYAELDALEEVRNDGEKALVQEARKFSITKLLATCPGLGPGQWRRQLRHGRAQVDRILLKVMVFSRPVGASIHCSRPRCCCALAVAGTYRSAGLPGIESRSTRTVGGGVKHLATIPAHSAIGRPFSDPTLYGTHGEPRNRIVQSQIARSAA